MCEPKAELIVIENQKYILVNGRNEIENEVYTELQKKYGKTDSFLFMKKHHLEGTLFEYIDINNCITLDNVIDNEHKIFPKTMKRIIRDLFIDLNKLHSVGYCHMDIGEWKNLVYIKFGNSYKYPIDCDSMSNILFIEIAYDYNISTIINLSNKNITIFRRGFFWHGYASHFTRDPSFLLISETKIVDIYLSTQLMLYMVDIIMNKKYIHSGLHQEMVNKVLNPMRLKCICDEYNISFYDLIKNYYL